ncbi:MAG: AAA family ATPase, partial [Bacteroidales bacterium]|nr:AAA family ATPase [Bacteroidales bacterium]
MAKLQKDNLGYLGVDFQYKLIKIFIEEPEYFIDFSSIINQNAFTDTYLKTVVGVIKEYYKQYDVVPKYDMLLTKLREKAVTEDDVQYYEETIDKIRRSSIEGLEEVGNIAERFFKQQEMIKGANRLKEIAGSGDLGRYDECLQIFERINSIKRRDADMSSPFDNMDGDLSKEDIVSIPTGVARLDDALGGGLDKGKIGIIIGSMGFGKTSMTTCFAANAATTKCEANDYEGYKVLQIVFEDSHRDIHRKYFSKVAQVETRNINKDKSTTDKVREILNNSKDKETLNNNIRIVRFPSGEKSASDIREFIRKLIREGFKPDLVIVDYFGCVAPEPGTSKDDITARESATMRKFENMAPELDIAMWIPVQGNRDSITAELVTNDKIGGSIAKNQIAQVVLSITRSVDDIKDNLATITLLKNRSGLGGLTLSGVLFNNGTCTISSDNMMEFADALAYNEYAADRE